MQISDEAFHAIKALLETAEKGVPAIATQTQCRAKLQYLAKAARETRAALERPECQNAASSQASAPASVSMR